MLDNYDPDAYWCFDRKPVSLSDYGWDPYSSYERTGETAPDSAGLIFGPATGPEADDPDTGRSGPAADVEDPLSGYLPLPRRTWLKACKACGNESRPVQEYIEAIRVCRACGRPVSTCGCF